MNIDLRQGDCRELIKTLEDNSVHSIITDGPYELNMMGRDWDNTGIAYDINLWKECLRVLKPGGHLLSFSHSRTYHRMTCAIEDAGFEIRDQIMWVYACYSEDTECFTDSGWKKYSDIVVGVDKVLQWEHTTGEFTWYTPEQVFTYDTPDEMVHFQNRHTDQLLTKNHRCYAKVRTHARNPAPTGYTVFEAKDMKRRWMKDFPVAGNLMGGKHVGDAYLVGWWATDAWVHGDKKACMFSQAKSHTLVKLRDALRNADCHYSEYLKERKRFNPNHNDEISFYVTGNLADFLLTNWPTRTLGYEVLGWDRESRHNLLEGLLDGDGSRPEKQHGETFWSLKHDKLDLVSAICCSLGIRNYVDYKKGCVYLNRKTATTQLQNKHVTEVVKGRGKVVWCLKTETGAFLVRRNGKPFISGNSGMPKSGGLKPCHEPICVARKPFKGSAKSRMEEDGIGSYNIEQCRVPVTNEQDLADFENNHRVTERLPEDRAGESLGLFEGGWKQRVGEAIIPQGRYPGNIITDGSACVRELFPDSKGQCGAVKQGAGRSGYMGSWPNNNETPVRGDAGSAARFFNSCELTEEDCEIAECVMFYKKARGKEKGEGNNHISVKPVSLMRHLIRLVTPVGGTTLDIFMGSGSTGVAAKEEGVSFIGFEMEDDSFNTAVSRCK